MNPHWHDHCGHGPDAYIATVRHFQSPTLEIIGDIYLYTNDLHGLSVCIRTGPESHEYQSVGSIFNLHPATSDFDRKVVSELYKQVDFTWKRKDL